MEHFRNPFCPSDFAGTKAVENRSFFETVLEHARNHAFYRHSFLRDAGAMSVGRDVAASILTSFYKIVSPFTGMLCALGGRSPTLECRFALLDNIYEEMGCGDIEAAHPMLYLRMLESIGVTEDAAERAPVLAPIRRINEHLREVVEREPFAVACAVLASAEATIPPSFPVLAAMARDAFPEVDTTFFDRHGVRDEGHSGDAAMLFALTAEGSQFAAVEAAVERDLDYRTELFDEWCFAIASGVALPRVRESYRPAARSVRPQPRHSSVPPPG